MLNTKALLVLAVIATMAIAGIASYFVFTDAYLRSGGGADADLLRRLAATAEKLPPPQPGEWRYDMHERAQSLGDFMRQRWARPASGCSTIVLVPLDSLQTPPVPDPVVLRDFVSAYFGLPCTLLPVLQLDEATLVGRPDPATGRRQYLTEGILDAVKAARPRGAFCCAAITARDLYPEPSWEFVFGQSSLTYRVGVVGFARFNPAFGGAVRDQDSAAARLVLLRSCKVLAHETAHMFGLFHCVKYRCAMNGSNNLRETDARPAEPCPECLAKLQSSIGFGCRDRWEGLRRFYEETGLDGARAEIDVRLRVAAPARP